MASKGKPLSREDIKKLLSSPSQSTTWPGKENLRRLAVAVREGLPTVTFIDGMEFNITYDDHSKWDSVFVKRTDGKYVPCGYFNRHTLDGVLKT